MSELGKFISRMRLERNLTQKELAEKMHLSVSTISKWENGISVPSVAFFEELAKALDVSVMELFDCVKGETAELETVMQEENQSPDIEVAAAEQEERIEAVQQANGKIIAKPKLIFTCILLLIILSVVVGLLFYRQRNAEPHTVVADEYHATDVDYYGYSDVYYIAIEYDGDLTDEFIQEYRNELRINYEEQFEKAELLVVLFFDEYLGKESKNAPDLELVLLPSIN